MQTGPVTPWLPCVALLAAAVAAAGAAGRELVVDVQLAASAQLSATARAGLIREVNDIWQREGVRLQWPFSPPVQVMPGAGPNAVPDFALRALVVQRERATRHSAHQWPVGELLFDQAENAVAVASIEAAERVLATAARDDEPTALHDRRLGVILGRALAHEMGHYLLNTPGHARLGLMRASIDARDFADLRSGAFFLDAPAGEWIRGAVAPSASAQSRLARFVYAP